MQLTHLLLVLALIGQTAPAAEPIHTVYDSYSKWTEIKTNWLYVVNDSDQFLQLKLIARFSGKAMPRTGPTSLEVEIISHSPKYQYVGLPQLTAIADGAELPIGNMAAHPGLELLGKFKGGREGGQSMVNQVSPLPASAAVLARHNLADLSAEWIVTDISWENLSALAKANRIKWNLGGTEFLFTEIQVNRLKQFVTAITPSSGVVVAKPRSEQVITDKPIHPDTPSDSNKTNLKETLDWLKTQTNKYGTGLSLGGLPETLTLSKVDNCNIEFRLLRDDVPELPNHRSNPASFSSIPTLSYTSMNLKDLDPGSVQISVFGDRFWLRFSTRNREQSIRTELKTEDTGQNLRGHPRFVNSAIISLKKNDYGPEIRDAFSHAVRLCQ